MKPDKNLSEEQKKRDEANENSENQNLTDKDKDEQGEHHDKKEHHKKNEQLKHENERLEKMDKEEIIKEFDKLYKENEKLKKLAEEKEKESIEYLDRYRRSLAEVENVRKRFIQEKQDTIKYSNFNIISDLLLILDDFERAIESAKNGNPDLDNYKQGIEMINNQLHDLLFKKYGVNKFGENGEEFDPNKHQAMMMEEGDYDKEVLLEVFRSGYMLHDRVIRAAQVKVGKPKNS